MNSAFKEGKEAARGWIERYEQDFTAEQPRNPHPRKSDDSRFWSVGFSEECYRRFGDPDRDMVKLERQFGC